MKPGTTGYNLYTHSANNPTTFTDPTGQAVLAEYAALVGDQADLAEIISSGVGNCATASFSRVVAGLEGYQLGEDPGQAVLRDCARVQAKPFCKACCLALVVVLWVKVSKQ